MIFDSSSHSDLPAVQPGQVLGVFQECFGDQGGVEVTALQLGQQGVSVELPDLLEVAEYEVSLERDGQLEVAHLKLVTIPGEHHLQVINVVHLSVQHLLDNVFPPENFK